MTPTLVGTARRFGDDVNTDYIISSRRKRESLDPAVLKQYLFETIAPEFAASLSDGDILVAGKNFGCGSAMEVAVTAVVGAGIRAVLAQSFARTYFRNAVNNGLYPIVCDTSRLAEGARLRIEFTPHVTVWCDEGAATLPAEPIQIEILNIINSGGIVPYLIHHASF